MSTTTAKGFLAAGVVAGLKSSGNRDVALVVNQGPKFDAAGVFTSNRVKAAPVQWSQQVLASMHALKAVVLNSGGANACTRTGYDGKYPVLGWSSKYDWIGYIPFDALPSIFNPRENFIVTANNAVIFDQTYPYFLTDDWAYGSRSQRIRDLITDAVQNGKKIDVATMQDFQMDARNELADIIVPTLVEVGGDRAAILKDWDGQMTVDCSLQPPKRTPWSRSGWTR